MSLRLIPVIDLLAGVAVHARGGRRADYRPVQSVLCPGADPLTLARAYRDVLGTDHLYLADLDAIRGKPPAAAFYRDLARLGVCLWVDAGVKDARAAGALIAAGVGRVIVATETLPGGATLRDLAREVGPETLVFGLDLHAGRPIVARGASWPSEESSAMVERAWEVGIRRFLFVDLSRVGSGAGVSWPDLSPATMRRLRDAEVTVGGGVRGRGDLEVLGRSGVASVLVGSAFHDGRLSGADVRHFSSRGAGPHDRSTSAD